MIVGVAYPHLRQETGEPRAAATAEVKSVGVGGVRWLHRRVHNHWSQSPYCATRRFSVDSEMPSSRAAALLLFALRAMACSIMFRSRSRRCAGASDADAA